MNGFATLDILPHQRYIIDKVAVSKPLPAHIVLLYFLHLRDVYTELGIHPALVVITQAYARQRR